MTRSLLVRMLVCLSLIACGRSRAEDVFEQPAAPQAKSPNTIRYEGAVYVALTALHPWFGIISEHPAVAAQKVRVQLDGKTWEFLNGGDRVAVPGGREEPLVHPLLVIEGELYLHERDASTLFGVAVSPTQVVFRNRTVEVKAKHLESSHHHHRIDAVSPESYGIRLTSDVKARTALHPSAPAVTLCAGSIYVCRRQVTIDGIPSLLLTDSGTNPQSVAVSVEAIKDKSQRTGLEETDWARRMAWFRKAAMTGQGLRFGARENLPRSLCATADFCWSLRPMESDFLLHAPMAARLVGPPAIALFISGRWLEQHPADMETLIGLGEGGGVALTWGLHSWVHPKSGDFMNDLSVEAVQADTLRLERQLLEWGIVPTVYYRFPGLIHDPARLNAILAMDLFPIDCDAWVAVQAEGMHPFGGPIRDGSIVLVHGNGNEPLGIAQFQQWLRGQADWQWRPLPDFLPAVEGDAR